MTKKNIAIIGAGLSGLVLTEELSSCADIKIFEKARGVGGRMSTRYADDFQFDHGAQYFTARSKGFYNFLKPFVQSNIVKEWTPNIVILEPGQTSHKRDWLDLHYTAAPKMNMVCKAIAKNHNVQIKTKIETLSQTPEGWMLNDEGRESHGPFDWVISTAPAPQTAALLPKNFEGAASLSDIEMLGCYSLMLGFSDDLNLSWDAAKVKNSPIGWMAVNSSKPLRDHGYSLVVQTTNDWAEAHINDDQDNVRAFLMHEVERLLERTLTHADYISLHRWRYANTLIHEDTENNGYFLDDALHLAACGDWCVQGRVESAYLSATSLADTLKTHW